MSILMRKWYAILLFMASCSAENIDNLENVAIFGLWESGEKPTIQAVIVDGDSETFASNQSFELVFPDGETYPFISNGQTFVLQSERTPQPEEILKLLWYREGDTAFATVIMPPAVDNLVVINDTLQAEDDAECQVDWTMQDTELEFAFRLESLEQNPQPLPWSPGNFLQFYSGPQLASQLTLQPQSFAAYGSYLLTISVLNDELRDIFFFDPSDIRGLVRQGPDNVVGGKGFVAGVAVAKIPLEIE